MKDIVITEKQIYLNTYWQNRLIGLLGDIENIKVIKPAEVRKYLDEIIQKTKRIILIPTNYLALQKFRWVVKLIYYCGMLATDKDFEKEIYIWEPQERRFVKI